MGTIVGIAAPVMHLNAGEWTQERAAGFVLITMGDMVLFGSLFIAAVIYRRKPEIHKRLMLAATVALLFAAVGRLPLLDRLASSGDRCVAVAAADRHALRSGKRAARPHVAYVIGAVWLFLGATRVLAHGV